jgi:hypothetical protein
LIIWYVLVSILPGAALLTTNMGVQHKGEEKKVKRYYV